MPIILPSGGGGGGSQPDGSVVPVADSSGVILDTTTYDDPITGSGKLATLVFPSTNACAVAIAIAGDDFPRYLFQPDQGQAFYIGDGTIDPSSGGPAAWVEGPDVNGHYELVLEAGMDAIQTIRHGRYDANVGYFTQFSNGIATGNPLDANQVVVSGGIGAPAIGGNVGDLYIRKDGGDGSWIYRCTVAGAAGVATWVAKL